MASRELTADAVYRNVTLPDSIDNTHTDVSTPFIGGAQQRFHAALARFTRNPTRTGAAKHLLVIGAGGGESLDLVEKHLRHVLTPLAGAHPPPADWVLLHNFERPRQPLCLPIGAGKGVLVAEGLARAFAALQAEVPIALQTNEEVLRVQQEYEEWIAAEEVAIADLASQHGLQVVTLPGDEDTLQLRRMSEDSDDTPDDGKEPCASDALSYEDSCREIAARTFAYKHERLRRAREAQRKQDAIARTVVEGLVEAQYARVKLTSYDAGSVFGRFLASLKKYTVLKYAELFGARSGRGTEDEGAQQLDVPWQVNVLVHHKDTKTLPLTARRISKHTDLYGMVGYTLTQGMITTNHTLVVPGALQEANGGYLILALEDLLITGTLWPLLVALRDKAITVPPLSNLDPLPMPAVGLRVVLCGSREHVALVQQHVSGFNDLFSIHGTIEDTLQASDDEIGQYAQWIKEVVEKDCMHRFKAGAVARIIEYALRQGGGQTRLDADMAELHSLMEEAHFLVRAERRADPIVTRADVQAVLAERRFAADSSYARIQQAFHEGRLVVDVDGAAVGRVNGLAVYAASRSAGSAFGAPTRITAVVHAATGEGKLRHIDIHQSGSTAVKANGIVDALLRSCFAAKVPTAYEGHISFDQMYGGIDGDSATLALFIATVSALSRVPVKQSLAITGSCNMHGQVLPIGGVNEKVEGFYDVCVAKGGLTGTQGVLIPEQNVQDLMLREDVVRAIEEGMFHVYAVDTLDSAVELMTGQVAGTRTARHAYTPRDSVFAKAQHTHNEYWKRRKTA